MKKVLLFAYIFINLNSIQAQTSIKTSCEKDTAFIIENVDDDASKPNSIIKADGTNITYEEFERLCNVAWINSFGKMTESEEKLLKKTKISFDF